MGSLFKTGITLIVVAFVLWLYKDFGNTLPISKNLDTIMGYLGAACIGIHLLIYLYITLGSKTWKTSHRNRCVRCGAKVPKGEIYCSYHQVEFQNDYLNKKKNS